MKRWRQYVVAVLFFAGCVAIASRVAFLTVTERQFLQDQGNARSLRTEVIPAHRGIIYDRKAEPLALSTPVASIWINPQRTTLSVEQVTQISSILQVDAQALQHRLTSAADKGFKYLQRRVKWTAVQEIRKLKIPGLNVDDEYRRYYPASETTAHIVGMTGIDDQGLEGVELAFNDRLRGREGSKQVLKNRRGNTVDNLKYITDAKGGQDLTLSLDRRLQFFAYRELKAAVAGHRAKAASVVMLDARTGEILAMANEPSYNPNETQSADYTGKRNIAVTDTYEPGSTIKPFAVLAALESGDFTAQTLIDTSPGYMQVGNKLIEDPVNRGEITLAEALQKSSQVGIAKVALELPERAIYDVLARSGIGEFIGTGLPGEAVGYLSDANITNPVVRSTLAYGYGLAVSPLQLAAAYLTLANQGQRVPITILRRETQAPMVPTFSPEHTQAVLKMMEGVTLDAGTAAKARVDGYRVAGKTGTARKLGRAGYDDERHIALFAGIAPAEDPRIVMVVVVDEPKGEATGGGAVAAPVFARIAERSLRLLGVTPSPSFPQVSAR